MTDDVQRGMLANSTALTKIAEQQAANSQQLFNTAMPGFNSAESFYQALSTGDPYAISRAIAPAAQQINQATTGARENIINNTPVGGERNLALDQADLQQGAQVGSTASNAYLSAFPALAQLAGQGVNQSISSAGTGISGYGTANQGLQGAGQLGIEQKGAGLGALGSLGGGLAQAGGQLFSSPAFLGAIGM